MTENKQPPSPQPNVVGSRPGLVPVALGVVAASDGAGPAVVADGVEAVVGLNVVTEHPCEQCRPYDANNDDRFRHVHDAAPVELIPSHVRNFIGKVQGVCLGVAMSGRDHPNPDGALMELVEEAQTILFPVTMEGQEG